MKLFKATVKGMHCPSCEMLIEDSFEEAGAKNIKISWKEGVVQAEFDQKTLSEEKLKSIIIEEGYEVL